MYERHICRVIFVCEQAVYYTLKLKNIFRSLYEQHFKKAVTEAYIRMPQLYHSAHRCGICDGTENIISRYISAVISAGKGYGFYFHKRLGSVENISKMPEGVFKRLGGHIRRFGKSPEGSHINKIPTAVHKSCVVQMLLAAYYSFCGFQRIRRQLKPRGKIVGASGGNVAYGNGKVALKQAVYRAV